MFMSSLLTVAVLTVDCISVGQLQLFCPVFRWRASGNASTRVSREARTHQFWCLQETGATTGWVSTHSAWYAVTLCAVVILYPYGWHHFKLAVYLTHFCFRFNANACVKISRQLSVFDIWLVRKSTSLQMSGCFYFVSYLASVFYWLSKFD